MVIVNGEASADGRDARAPLRQENRRGREGDEKCALTMML